MFRMKDGFITGIGRLIIGSSKLLRGNQLGKMDTVEDAYLGIENGRVRAYGKMDEMGDLGRANVIDVGGGWVMPAWCDSHTHMVFAGSREGEFVDRIGGLSYEEIAGRGGGIMNSARMLRKVDEAELLEGLLARIEEVREMGTGVVEIKSGYGLSLKSELKMLRVIEKARRYTDVKIVATFLGAHTVPFEYKVKKEDYVDLVIDEMLPNVVKEKLAKYVDVFCESVAFDAMQMGRILEAGAMHGLKAKVHTNQFTSMGGIETAVMHGAISVDHLEVLNDKELEVLGSNDVISTVLPGAPFFLNDKMPNIRKMIDGNARVALATDFNPGSCPSGNMSLVVALACIKCGMLPEEAINAATIGGAEALELGDNYGSLHIGKVANLMLLGSLSSLAYLPYAFGSRLVKSVILQKV